MTDTPASVIALYSEELLRQPPWRRIEMACSMFSAARALALAGERSLRGELGPIEERAAVFVRFYGEDFTAEAQARIEAYLRAA